MSTTYYRDPTTGGWVKQAGSAGAADADGKSAYDYAVAGGYTGTEAEFAEKLAKELPDMLPNPNDLTINGISYDGSKAVDLTEAVNTLINDALGVIENGSY